MGTGLYISHPEVNIDPDVPVERWGLSETGEARARTFAARQLITKNTPIYSSTETKAMELTQILAERSGSHIFSSKDFCENDRSSTGFLEPAQFETQVKRLFEHPTQSASGWESAADAQSRIVKAVHNALKIAQKEELVIFCGHGCVGTLLKCHLANRPIAQSEDQREMANPGGGNIFAFDLISMDLLSDWTAMEKVKGNLIHDHA